MPAFTDPPETTRKPLESGISADSARRIYDWLGARYDSFSFYEAKAKALALDRLGLASGQWTLNVGLGTGKEHCIMQQRIEPNGVAVGIDLSPGMLRVAKERTGAPLCEADGKTLPFASAAFDRLLCTYVLDLAPLADLPGWLAGFRRVLKPGGRMAVLCLTEGVDIPSRAFVGLWKLAYRASPLACAGCRPLQIGKMARQAGFAQVEREVILQFGIPSELVIAE